MENARFQLNQESVHVCTVAAVRFCDAADP
jgi:hypothetical protein